MKPSVRHARYIRERRLKTLGLHDVFFFLSIKYRIKTTAGAHALDVRHGGNLNTANIKMTQAFPHLTFEQSAKAIIFHSKLGR